jgi:cytidine deaminase
MLDADERLLIAAREAAAFGYAPYSRICIGAAVRAGPMIYTGANVEIASFGCSMCAERIAIFNAVTAGAKQINALAVARLNSRAQLPCGACRQVMNEFGSGDAIVHVDGIGSFTFAQLLPFHDSP